MPITSLQQIVDEKKSVTTDELSQPDNRAAALEIQSKLCDLGILDPVIGGDVATPFGPVGKGDGQLGLNSRNALLEFHKLVGVKYKDRLITPEIAELLLRAEPETFLPIEWDDQPSDSGEVKLAKKILRYMRSKNYWIARSPRTYNIAYVEGMNSDGSLNEDKFDEWNDRRFVIRIAAGGKIEVPVNDQATTEPGAYYTRRPLNRDGAARLAFGQYKAWVVGKHQGTQPALVQRELVKVHRDKNQDGKRSTTDPIDIGKAFGVNQHTTSRSRVPDFVGRYSAGCLVGRRYDWHMKFLGIVKKDFRFELNFGYLFVSAVIAGDDLLRFDSGAESFRGSRSVGAAPSEVGFQVWEA